MTALMPILAAGGEDPTVKIIIGVAVAIFWIIAQVAGALSKKPDKKLPPSGQLPPQIPPKRQQRQPQMSRQQQSQRKQPQQKQQRRQPPPLRQQPTPVYEQPVVARSRLVESSADTRQIGTQASSATPKALPRREMINALLRPRNLKRALIVNELLQPPVALRGERE